MLSFIFLLFALCHLGLFVRTLAFTTTLTATRFSLIFLRCLLLTLAFDNLVIALGPILLNTDIYLLLSTLRFWGHALLLPFLLVFVAQLMRQFPGCAHPRLDGLAWGLAIVGVVYGYFFDLGSLELVPADFYPRLIAADGQPPFATIVVNLFVVLAGIWMWRKAGWPWLFIGALQIFIVNGMSAGHVQGFVAGNAAEVVFVASLLATLVHASVLRSGDDAGRSGSHDSSAERTSDL